MASWRPLGTSWAAVGRQMAAKTALEALLGSWGGLGGSWAALGASLDRLGPARRSPEGRGRLRGRAPGDHLGFLIRVLALIFAFILLAWHASGEAANSEKS